ncbi:MAG: FAD-binding protein [Acidimicrobiales bacterium]|nr:FAD-binding protein [Acidimicrobiales bacterium]
MIASGVAGRRITDEVAQFATLVGSDDPVAVEGNRTRWDAGGPATGSPRIVKAPAGVVQYQPDEMTVKVLAGTTVAELDRALAGEGQRTALPQRGGTVGGALAVGENHPHTLAVGALRTAVLKVTYVSADGKIVSGGGATVKNVSGFDIPRLIVGSLGTLGCIAEVILRTNPIPAVSRWFHTLADPFAIYNELLAPAAVFWDGSATWLLLEGHEVDVDHQASVAAGIGELTPVDGPPDEPGLHRWSLPPGELQATMTKLEGPALASIGVGTIWATEPQPERPLSPAVEAIHDRMKTFFDPDRRLNPGRHPGRR